MGAQLMAARLGGSWTGYHARVSPGRTARHDLASGRRISYAGLEDRVARLAGALADGFGVRRGDRVAMLLHLRHHRAAEGRAGHPRRLGGHDAGRPDELGGDKGLGVPHRAAGLARGRGRPEETAQAVADGWLRTGDVAVMTDSGQATDGPAAGR